jgi:hypothetical protein
MKKEAELTQRTIEISQRLSDQATEKINNQDLAQLQKTLQEQKTLWDFNSKWPDRELETLRATRDSLQSQVKGLQLDIKELEKYVRQMTLDKSKSDDSAPVPNTK